MHGHFAFSFDDSDFEFPKPKGEKDGDSVQVEGTLLRLPEAGANRPGEDQGGERPALPGAHVREVGGEAEEEREEGVG